MPGLRHKLALLQFKCGKTDVEVHLPHCLRKYHIGIKGNSVRQKHSHSDTLAYQLKYRHISQHTDLLPLTNTAPSGLSLTSDPSALR